MKGTLTYIWRTSTGHRYETKFTFESKDAAFSDATLERLLFKTEFAFNNHDLVCLAREDSQVVERLHVEVTESSPEL